MIFWIELCLGICPRIGSILGMQQKDRDVSIQLHMLDTWFCLRRSKFQGLRRIHGILCMMV
jgi:hypothetical protein